MVLDTWAKPKDGFLTAETFQDVLLAAQGVMILTKVYREQAPNMACDPSRQAFR